MSSFKDFVLLKSRGNSHIYVNDDVLLFPWISGVNLMGDTFQMPLEKRL